MTRLLSANFMRLKKDKPFWLFLSVMIAAGILLPVISYADARRSGYTATIDSKFFTCGVLIAVIASVFCSLFFGTEYSDGTLRNKIICGHNRYAIYLANFIFAATVSLAMCAAYFTVYIIVGMPILGAFTLSAATVALLVFTTLMLAVAFTAVFTLISILCSNKATTVICVLTAFGLLAIGFLTDELLAAPKTFTNYVIIDGVQTTVEELNPNYLEGSLRIFVQTLHDILPGGQAMQCLLLDPVHLGALPVYSLVIACLTTSLGMLFFQKKDIK